MQEKTYKEFYKRVCEYCDANKGEKMLLYPWVRILYHREKNLEEINNLANEENNLVGKVIYDLVREGKVKEILAKERPKELDFCLYGYFEILNKMNSEDK